MKKIWTFITDNKLEVGTAIFFICAIAFITFTAHSCTKSIKKAGGFRYVIVESGKEIKLLANDINEAYEEEKANSHK